MKATNMLLIIFGIVLFLGGIIGHSVFFAIFEQNLNISPYTILGIVGIIFIVQGLWFNEKEKKAK
jgi:uncharacterized membrane protein